MKSEDMVYNGVDRPYFHVPYSLSEEARRIKIIMASMPKSNVQSRRQRNKQARKSRRKNRLRS